LSPRFIDGALHPLVPKTSDFNTYLEEPWSSRGVSYGFQQGAYRPPIPPYVADSVPEDGSLPSSDPGWVDENVLRKRGIDVAILIPLMFGLMPEIRFDDALASATNRWLAERWLDTDVNQGQFKGSIRINPRNVSTAVAEIEHWADHPHVVQIAVPLESHVAYGQEIYFPIWEAASSAGLPVAFHSDGWAGAQLPPTGAGYPSFYLEAHTLLPMLAIEHLGSLIAEGVLDRLPELRLVFADGGFGLLQPIMWRVDRVWRSLRFEAPWILSAPTSYIRDRVRVMLHDSDLLAPERMERLLDASGAADFLLYGSNYPFWDDLPPASALEHLPPEVAEQIAWRNAADWYALPATPGLHSQT
jgi:predicted TIM-barrel fold metal-dependent hydrolase